MGTLATNKSQKVLAIKAKALGEQSKNHREGLVAQRAFVDFFFYVVHDVITASLSPFLFNAEFPIALMFKLLKGALFIV